MSKDVTGGIESVPVETRFFSYFYCMMYAHPEATPEYFDGTFQSVEEIVNDAQIKTMKQMAVDRYSTMDNVDNLILMNFGFLGMVGGE